MESIPASSNSLPPHEDWERQPGELSAAIAAVPAGATALAQEPREPTFSLGRMEQLKVGAGARARVVVMPEVTSCSSAVFMDPALQALEGATIAR